MEKCFRFLTRVSNINKYFRNYFFDTEREREKKQYMNLRMLRNKNLNTVIYCSGARLSFLIKMFFYTFNLWDCCLEIHDKVFDSAAAAGFDLLHFSSVANKENMTAFTAFSLENCLNFTNIS